MFQILKIPNKTKKNNNEMHALVARGFVAYWDESLHVSIHLPIF